MAGELSERERITSLMMRGWGDERSYSAIVRLLKTIERFRETDSVKNCSKLGRTSFATNEEQQLDVLQTFIENPNSSVNRVVQTHDIAPMSI